MRIEMPRAAKELDLLRTDYNLLLVALGWFNGRSFRISGEKHQIGSHYEPAIEDLCLSKDLEYDPAAHERLLGAEWFTEETICRRKVDWVPTQEGLEKMEIACEEHAEHVVPHWAKDRPSHSPVVGDNNESLLHRKGVEIARKTLDYHWLFPLPPDRSVVPDFIWYPSNQYEERTVDIEINTREPFRPWGVEVVTEREDLQAVAEKWGRFASVDRRIVWLFENRVHACEVLNALSVHGELGFPNGRIRNPENWAVRNLNRRFWQAEKSHELANADILHTVTGMLEASQDEIKSYFREFKDYER